MRVNFKFYTRGRFSRFLALWGVFFLILFHCGYAHTDDIIFNEEQPPVAPILKDSISGQGKEFSVITIQGSTITLISDLDYAFTPFGELGSVQRISLGARF